MPKRSHVVPLLFALGALHQAVGFDLQNRHGDAGPAEEHVGVTMKVVGEEARTGGVASTVFVHAPGRTFEVEIRNGLPEGVHVSILRFSTSGGLERVFPSNLDSEPSELIPSGLTRRASILVEAPMGPDLLILAWSAEPFDNDFLSLTESAPRRRPRRRSERRVDPSDSTGDDRGGRTDAEKADLGARRAERSGRATIPEAFRDVHLPPKPPLDGAIRRNIRPQVVASTSLRFYYDLTTEASLVEPERERYALGELAYRRAESGDIDGALSAYRDALETGERHSIPPEWSTFSQMGFLESTVGRPGEALQLYRNALERADEVAYDRGKAIVLNNLGTLQRTLGRFDEALAQFESILDLPVMESDPLLRAVIHNNIGLTLVIRPKATEADRIDALEHYRRALDAQKEASNRLTAPDNTRITRSRAGGTVSSSIGRQFAAAIGVSSDNPMTARMITLHNIGDVFRRMGKSDSARVNLEFALAIFDEIVGDARSKSATLTILGHVELSSNRPDLSEIRYREALSLLMETEDAGAIATAHQNLAEFFYSVRGDVRRALAHYDSAATARALVRNSLREDLDRLSFSEQDVGLYAGWALAWLSLQSEIGRDEAAFAAIAASEKGRARALLDLMRLNAEDDPSSILSAVPSGSMSAQGRALTKAAMDPSTAALSYLVTPDTLIVWLIADRGIHISRVPVRQDSLAAGVSRLRVSMGVDQAGRGAEMLEERGVVSVGAGDAASFEDLRDELSSILIPNEMRELLPGSGDLLIVPHSVLNLIPFAALTLDERGILLGERFAIQYAPSLTTLALASSRPTDFRAGIADHRDALIVGNPTMPDVALSSGVEVQLGPLPGAEREAKWVAEHIGTEWLAGSEATESTVRRRLSGAKLAHLATHGFAFSSQARARDSFVALAPDTGNDGLLTVGEVLDSLELSAELIVLSACQTGLGDLKQAEGTVGLQRALLAKGARTALVSLWSVSDEATELLMKRFYEHWLASESTGAAEALKAAQGDVRLTPGFEHPKFWAAFQLVGGG